MSKTILVRMEIPVGKDYGNSSDLIFSHWLPLQEDEALVIDKDRFMVKIWFDLNCSKWIKSPNEIEKHTNTFLYKAYVDVQVKDLSDELANFIYQEKDACQEELNENQIRFIQKQLSEESEDLAKKVFQLALENFNRMLSYFRNYKLQFWIEEHKINFNSMRSEFTRFRTMVKVDGHDWVPWCPPVVDNFGTFIIKESQRSEGRVTKEEWSEVSKFVNSQKKPKLFLELLANAASLADKGYERSALIEGVSALEVSISLFSKAPKYDGFIHQDAITKISEKGLKDLVEKLGIRGTINILFPLLFKPEIVSKELANDCQNAVDARNNVVHNGQRKVNNEQIWKMLNSIYQMCIVLEKYTNNTEGN